MLGTGLIGRFYTISLQSLPGIEVGVACASSEEEVKAFAAEFDIPRWSTSIEVAINDPDTDTVVIGLPNYLHKQAALLAAKAGKAVLCTKPLATNAQEARTMLEAVEEAGVFHGYLEDLVYTPKTLKALQAVKNGALGKILWARSRETHAGPHSDWFRDVERSGGGAIVDMGCHCIEIARDFIGKDVRPVEVTCWADTQVHPIEADDHAIGLVRYENGAIGQFEVSWTFRGGMDLRDEIAGTEGTIWLNHWLRTGFEMFTGVGQGGYVAEKAEGDTGWLFPVGDEVVALGYVDMFRDMFRSMDSGTAPMETFYDGYIVNAIIDASYQAAKTKKWEPVELEIWRGKEIAEHDAQLTEFDEAHDLVKEEVILENAYLTDEQKVTACKLCEEAGADWVKTSTGFAPSGATHEDLRLMRETVSEKVHVKAAHGVRTLDTILPVIDIGCDRVGATATAIILDEFERRSKSV